MTRLFIGVFVPDEIRRHVDKFQRQAGRVEGLRWTPLDALHVTLKFLGRVPDEKIATIQSVLEGVASRRPPMTFSLESRGVFPARSNPRIFWVGIRGQIDVLRALADEMEEGLTPVGYPPENRKFKPHLTIGRVAERDTELAKTAADQFCTLFSDYSSPEFSIREVHLIQSDVHPSGSTYKTLATFPLRIA